MKDKYEILRDVFGYAGFRPGQDRIIDAILRGADVLGIMPTGAGKSLCYQIPALALPGITLVISPLISLMCDQVSSLNARGIHAAYLNSSLAPSQLEKAFRLASEGRYKLLYLSPERLATKAFLRFAENADISLVCVDEAHCISQWGNEFRPAYRCIADFIAGLPKRPTVCAFTATATFDVRDDIISALRLIRPFCLSAGFDRPNLYFGVAQPKDKFAYLQVLLRKYRGQCGIIYCLTRRTVEMIARRLNRLGYPALRYHGGLSDEERRENQAAFLNGSTPFMVATNAFGMGIDKPDVRFVIHYNMPRDMEGYYQEAGRAGRDGLPSDCILLYGPRDVTVNRFFLRRKESEPAGTAGPPSPARRRKQQEDEEEKLRQMIRYASGGKCLRAFMLDYFGEHAAPFCGSCSVCTGTEGKKPKKQKEEDCDLYVQLRALRLRIAKRKHILPDRVLKDRELHELATVKPLTRFDLLCTRGISLFFWAAYGPEFLTELRAFQGFFKE